MSLSPSDLRHAWTRAALSVVDLETLRAHLARGVDLFSELASHPDDDDAIASARQAVTAAIDPVLDTLDTLVAIERTRRDAAHEAVKALEAEEEREDEARDAGPIALSA